MSYFIFIRKVWLQEIYVFTQLKTLKGGINGGGNTKKHEVNKRDKELKLQ